MSDKDMSPLATGQSGTDDSASVESSLPAMIRIALVLFLFALCFTTVRPFLLCVIWGIIIAVATYPWYSWLQTALGRRRALATPIYIIIALAAIIIPTKFLAGTLFQTVSGFATDLSNGTVEVPPPPARIESLPVLGESLHGFWESASEDLQGAFDQIEQELKDVSEKLLGFAGQAAIGFAQFIIAIFIAAALVAHGEGGQRAVNDSALRLLGPKGPDYADLIRTVIRGVAQGIVGFSLLHAVLAGFSFLVAGVPGAGFLALLCLVLGVATIGSAPVLVYAVAYQFYAAETTSAVIFMIWCVLLLLFENIVKPMVLGRGVQVPMMVIFVGAMGGMLSLGILGLFIGPIVLALGYTLSMAWLQAASETALENGEVPPAGSSSARRRS
jgi:predicted PurR-regulated permease PerM